MFGTFDSAPTFIGLLFLVLIVGTVIAVNNAWRVGQLRWRIRTWKNRLQNPHLADSYRMAGNARARYLLAQQMMVHDRILERLAHNGAPGPNYPNIWDYHYEPGKLAYQEMKSRVASRRIDEQRVRSELQRVRTKYS